VHAVAFGTPLGLTSEQLVATVHGSADDPVWTSDERAVFRLADELHATSTVSDGLFADLSAHFSHEQIIELCLTAGWYHAISYVIRVARVPLEPWAARFPAQARAPAHPPSGLRR
jgi:alkylhydroperoxidase family enzyme